MQINKKAVCQRALYPFLSSNIAVIVICNISDLQSQFLKSTSKSPATAHRTHVAESWTWRRCRENGHNLQPGQGIAFPPPHPTALAGTRPAERGYTSSCCSALVAEAGPGATSPAPRQAAGARARAGTCTCRHKTARPADCRTSRCSATAERRSWQCTGSARTRRQLQGSSTLSAKSRCHHRWQAGLATLLAELLVGRSAANDSWCQQIHFPLKHVSTQGIIDMELTEELGHRRKSNGDDRYSGLCFITSLVIKEHNVPMNWIAQLLLRISFLSVDCFQREGLTFPNRGVTVEGRIHTYIGTEHWKQQSRDRRH